MTHRAQSDSTPDIEGAISLLKSDDEQVRQFAAYLLGQAGDARAVQPLIESLADTHVGVCGAAANALGKLGDPRAVPYLRPFVTHPNPQMVVWAAYALTQLGVDHFDHITDALGSASVNVRRSAILALQQLGDARAVGPLLALQHDSARRFVADTTVGEAVERALRSLGYDVGRLPPRSSGR